MIYIDEASKRIIDFILIKYPYRFFAYGSRTKNTHKEYSDLDLCVMGNITFDEYVHIKYLLEQANLKFKVDLNRWDKISDDFKQFIEKDLVPYNPIILTDTKVINLTNTIKENIPSWDGKINFKTEITNDYNNLFRCQKFQLNAGTSTHLDSPAHINPKGKTIENYNLENLSGPAQILYLEQLIDKDLKITEDVIKKYYQNFNNYWQNFWIILMTGWGKHWQNSEKYRNANSAGLMQFPTLTSDAANFLTECKIKGIMIDTLSVDAQNSDFDCHKIFLNNDILIIENIRYAPNIQEQYINAIINILPVESATEFPVNVNLIL